MTTVRNFDTKDQLIHALKLREVVLVDVGNQTFNDGDVVTIEGPHSVPREWMAQVELKNCDQGCMITRLIA